MLKLTKTQQKFVTQRNIGQAVIRGEAATGKTTMGIGRMLYLANHKCQENEHIAFIAVNEAKSQVAKNLFESEYNMQTISLFESEGSKAHILSIDTLMMKLYEKLYGTYEGEVLETIPTDVLQEAIMTVKKQYPRVKFLNEEGMAFICDELNWISSCGYDTLVAYSVADRKGCMIKLPKGGKGRLALWAVKEVVESTLKAQNKALKLVLQAQVLNQMTRLTSLSEGYAHIIVDDAQALTKVQLQVIKELYQGGDLLFLMDKNPCESRLAWLKRGQTFKQIGFNMTGRMRSLKGKVAKKNVVKKMVEVALTPLEMFMAEMAQNKIVSKEKQVLRKAHKLDKVKIIEKPQNPDVMPEQMNLLGNMTNKLPEHLSGKLPWYVETYKYVNKLTGIETIFQKDTSAGETYIDEVKQEDVEALPLYSSDIAAGEPIEIVEEISERFELPSELLHHKRGTYMLHVQGDSMIGANIDDGDFVVIQSGTVNNNEIAAVYYNGATTLKRIVQEGDHVLLVSENPKYRPIEIEDGDFRVMGKLIGIIKPII